MHGPASLTWGSTPEERGLPYPCDPYLSGFDEEYFRAVSVDADPALSFRWLCQLKVAPYSYDLLDNLGRQSPRELTPGVENLAVGQRVMKIFELVEFAEDEHLTLLLAAPEAVDTFGRTALSYVVRPISEGSCRLVVKLRVLYPGGPMGALMRRTLPWGDLIMMRRQLLTLKRLAEGTRAPALNPG